MAKNIGTIFVELDLDTSKYTKAQREILKGARTTSLDVERNWRIIGQKSDLMYDAMRQNILNAYNMIKNKAGITAAEIVRLEQAKNAKLQALYTEQFGAKSTMLDTLKNKWAAVAATAGIAIYGIKSAIMGMIKEGDELHKLSQKVGITVEKLSGLKHAAEMSGASIETFATATKTFAKALTGMNDEGEDTTRMLKIMGVTSKEPYEALMQLADAFMKLEDGAVRQVAAQKLLGRSAMDLIPVLKGGRAGIQAFADEAVRLNRIIDTESARSMEAFNDNLTRLKASAKGLLFLLTPLIEAVNSLFAAFGRASKQENLQYQLDFLNKEIERMERGLFGFLKPKPGSLAHAQIENMKKMRDELLATLDTMKQEVPKDRGMQKALENILGGGADKAKKLAEELTKIQEKLKLDIAKTGLDEFEQKIIDIKHQVAEMRKKGVDEQLLSIWEKGELAKIDTAKAKQAADAQRELMNNLTSVYMSEIEKRNTALEAWTEKQIALAAKSATSEADAEAKLTEIILALRHQRELNRIKDAEQEKANYLEVVESYITNYQKLTNLARKFGETELEYAKRRLKAGESNIDVLNEFAKEMKEAGYEGEDAYKKIISLQEELTEQQKELNATFAEGYDYGMRQYMQELEDGFKKGEQQARTTATAIENALLQMFDNPKKAIKGLFDYFVMMLKRMIVEAMASKIIIPITAGIGGVAGIASGSAGPLGGAAPLLGYGLLGGAVGGIGGAVGGIAGGLLGKEFAQPIAGAIGKVLGPKIGFGIFSAIPVIGAVLGGLLGGFLTSFFKKKKFPEMFLEFQAGNLASAYDVGKGWTGGALDVTGGLVGFGYKNVGDWTKQEQQILKMFAEVRDLTMQELEALGLDISGFFKDWKKWFPDLKGKTAEEIQRMLADAIGEYISFASGIDFEQWQKSGETLIESVNRVLTAFKAFPKVLENIDDYIDAINNKTDDVAKWKNALREASENISEMWKELKKLEDPADVLEMINKLKQATYEYHMSQIQFVQQLDVAISALEVELANFVTSMQMKIGELTGNLSMAIGATWQHIMNMYQKFQEAQTAGEKLQWLHQIISALDQWVAANIAAIQKQYQAQIEAINNQIDALNKQKEAINKQLEGLREQLRITQMWRNVVEAVKRQILDMMITSTSPRDIFERMSYAKDEIEKLRDLYAGAIGEDKAKYAQLLASTIQQYMSLAEEAFQRPSPQYQAIYEEMLKLLDSIRADAESYMGDEVAILKQIKQLEEQSNTINEQIKTLQERIADLNRQMQADIEAFKKDAAQYYEWAMNEGMRLYQEKLNELKEKLGDILGELSLQEYIALKQKEATDALQSLKAWADNYWTNLQSVLKGGNPTTAPTPTPAPTPAPSSTCPICGGQNGKHQAWCPYEQSWLGAKGAYVTKPTKMIVGEGGEPEYIIPLSKMKSFNNTTISIAPNINITTSGDVNAKTLAKTIEQVLIDSIKYGRGRKLVQELSR